MTTRRIYRHRLKDLLLFGVLALLMTYFTSIGLTFNGLLVLVDTQSITLGLLALSAGVWLIYHVWRGWTWYRTPFDLWFVLLLAVIGVSIVANPTVWRRSVQLLWYVMLYIAVWYLLVDMLTNQAMTRAIIVRGLLFMGAMVGIVGLVQVLNVGIGARPVGLIGNANAFATVMLTVIPFAAVQAYRSRFQMPRMLWMIYAVLAVGLLALSQSRAAILGFGVQVVILAFLLLWVNEVRSLAQWNSWWQTRSVTVRRVLQLGVVFAVIGVLGAGFFFYQTLQTGGRSLANRTYLWTAAIEQFQSQPLTGHGLFTYGRQLPIYDSIPNGQPQAHAHSLPLNVAAELGIGGLLVLVVGVMLVGQMAWRNLRQSEGQEQLLIVAAIVALIGYGVQHLLDLPAMMPAIALLGVLLVILTSMPISAKKMNSLFRRVGHPIGVAILWIVLIGAGWWHVGNYRQYFDALSINLDLSAGDYVAIAGGDLQTLIERDPENRAYILQQGFLYGLAAAEDEQWVDEAIQAYERYTELEPTHAQGWANLAALYYQAGERPLTRNAISQAILYAPEWDHFRRQRNIYNGVLRDAETIIPPEASEARNGENWARFQYHTEILPQEYLPQVGWGSD